MLTLEILAAGQGDALLLHHGSETSPLHMVIDGGPGGTWRRALEPRLAAAAAGVRPLALELVMVSHLDDDHINGILALLKSQADLADDRQPPTLRVGGLWVNVFDDLSGADSTASASVSASSALAASGPLGAGESTAVIASIPQGRRLRDMARRLSLPLNPQFPSGLVSSGDGADVVTFGDVDVQVLGPSRQRLEDLRTAWEAFLEALRRKESETITRSAAFLDDSVFNLSSIIALVRQGTKRMLLTGDARGDDILACLESAALLDQGSIHVDVLKVPHHGSSRNVTVDFFRQVTATNYVMSGNGTDDNPDLKTLAMLREARPGEAYHLWFSYRLEHLEAFVQAAQQDGERFEATFRPDADPSLLLPLD